MAYNKNLRLIPNKAQYKPGEEILLKLEMDEGNCKGFFYQIRIYELDTLIFTKEGTVESGTPFVHNILLPGNFINGNGAYGAFVTVIGDNDIRFEAETAFDIANHWRETPRYGFLSDFAVENGEDCTDVDFLNRHHITIVQFYDWMYRHDKLVPEHDEFTDPLGRSISLKVIKEKIKELDAHGIASIAYAAVYASLSDYLELHPEQALLRNDGKPYSLGNFFNIMDISADSEWTKHIINEFVKVIELGFHGLHLDQYGFPKKAIRQANGQKEVVYLKELYPSFINLTKQAVTKKSSDIGLIFNNVSNYPVHTTAIAEQEAIYIEVWDPMTHLSDIKHLIDRGRELSKKQVILAAYLPGFHPEHSIPVKEAEIGAVVTMATIFASGGYHLLLGEHENVLADAYYPKYGEISDNFKITVQHYYDFIVMYRNLLYDLRLEDISMTYTGGINTEIVFSKEGCMFSPKQKINSVWTIIKEKPGYLVLHAINLVGLENDVWHSGKKNPPTVLTDIEVTVEVLEEVSSIFWASPDGKTIQANNLEYEWIKKDQYGGNFIRFKFPKLEYWSMICIQTKAGVEAKTL